MAELPRYQQTGRIFADIPQLDFANVRESFKRSQALGNALDRMSTYAAKVGEKYVETEAEKYALENPISIDDIRQAQASGVSADELIKASSGGTVWEETLRKYQGEQLRTQLEVQGNAALTNILAMVETGQLTDPNEIKQKFESAIVGFERPLTEINTDSALAFKKSMATTASTFYKSAINKLEKDYINDQQIMSQFNVENNLKAANVLFQVETDPAKIEETRKLMFKRVYEQSRNGGTDFAQKQGEAFLKEFDAAKINHFTNVATSQEYAGNILDAVKRINKGDFGTSTALYNTLSEEDKKKVRDTSLAAWNDLYAATKKEEELLKIENKDKDDADVKSMLKMKDGSKEKIAKAEDLYSRRVITFDTLKSIVSPKDEGDGDIMAEANADRDIAYGRIKTERDLKKYYPSLNGKQTKRLLMSLTDKEVAGAKSKIRVAAGAAASEMVPVTDINTAGRIQAITTLYEGYVQEQNPDGTYKYNSTDAVNKAIEQYPKLEKVTSAKTKQMRIINGTTPTNGLKAMFPGFNPDTMSPDDYADKRKLDDTMRNKLKRQYKDYNAQKAITGLTAEAL
jgi:mRNA-degrading endonuclease HigB of HigAB toxin-antitoxin module